MGKAHGRYRGSERVQIQEKVNAMVCESSHAAGMVRIRIDMIDSNSVGPKLGHKTGIASALVSVE